MKLDADILEKIYWYNGADKWTVVTKEIGQKHRWYTDILVTFRQRSNPGPFWQFVFMDPATESQEGQDVFDIDADGMVECYEVFPREVTTTIYRP